MTVRLRFARAIDLFEAFPMARTEGDATPVDDDSLPYAQKLRRGGQRLGALTFCAYLLPRREAVLWACDSVRALPTAPSSPEAASLAVAEAWLRNPEDAQRYRAHETALAADQAAPATWAAHGAGFATRNLLPPDLGSVPLPEHLTALAVSTVFVLAPTRIARDTLDAWYDARLDRGLRLASEGA